MPLISGEPYFGADLDLKDGARIRQDAKKKKVALYLRKNVNKKRRFTAEDL